jgi:predicted ABC-type transport system involved in lysophospholipase L1 biosynthesis ATPase subunit
VADIFVEMLENEDVAMVTVTHNLDFARRFDRVLNLTMGELRDAE